MIGIVLLCVSAAGCRDQRRPAVNPGTGVIPLKVWVVVGPGEPVGSLLNDGCRLDQFDIQERIAHLQLYCCIFGSVVFQWSGEIAPIEDPALLPFQPRTRDSLEFHDDVVSLPLNWEGGKINIYFVGNVQTNVQDEHGVVALTWDPRDATTLNVEHAAIVLNDGGFGMDAGFDDLFTPPEITDYNILEHEMTHFLARFKDQTFGSGDNQRTYGPSEHLLSGPGPNILTPFFGAPIPLPLNIPGRWNEDGTENKEIFDRIESGLWPNP